MESLYNTVVIVATGYFMAFPNSQAVTYRQTISRFFQLYLNRVIIA